MEQTVQHPDMEGWRKEVLSGQTLLGFRDWLTDKDKRSEVKNIPLQPRDVLRSSVFYPQGRATVVLIRRNALEVGEVATGCGFWWNEQDVQALESFRLRHVGGWFFRVESGAEEAEAYLDRLGFLPAIELNLWRRTTLHQEKEEA